jgi:hypothetical protein
MAMDSGERAALTAQYRDGYNEVAEALLRISDRELDSRPAPGRWSVREIIHHLGDSEMNAAIRLRLLLAEDRPAIRGIDQDEFARRLHYDRPYQPSLKAFRWARQSTVDILERLTPEEWTREGTHSEVGEFGVETWLRTYAPHAHRHAQQIKEARAAINRASTPVSLP